MADQPASPLEQALIAMDQRRLSPSEFYQVLLATEVFVPTVVPDDMDEEEIEYVTEEPESFSLIVLDIELGDPDMDGLDVCKRIRGLGLNMPVIFLTVRATVEDLEYGLQVGGPGSDYVRKLEELRRQ